jgi:hypothetical protein
VTLKRLATAFRVFAFPETLGMGRAGYSCAGPWQGKNGGFFRNRFSFQDS